MRTILAEDETGKFKFEITDTAKLTYGPNVPYNRKDGQVQYSRKEGYALRVYEGTVLLACFTGVSYFRDEPIKVLRLLVEEEGNEVWKSSQGGYETKRSVTKKHSVVDEFDALNAVDVTPRKLPPFRRKK